MTDKERKLFEKLSASGKVYNGKVLKSRPVTFEMSKNLKASEEEVRMEFAKLKPGAVPTIIANPKGGGTGSTKPNITITVVYRYGWIDGFSDADLDTSREFCVELISESNSGKRWKREDIDSEDNGTNDPMVDSVWESRGGWYTKPGTDIHIPHCRHQWIQEVISE